MKYITVLFFAFAVFSASLSTNLYAKQSTNQKMVGAFAVYSFSSPESRGTRKVELTNYNSQSNRFTQVTTTTLSTGEVTTAEEKISADEINSQEDNQVVLSLCESELDGKLETITIDAGTFESCALKEEASTFYFADVPFGYVKLISEIQNIDLKSFSF